VVAACDMASRALDSTRQYSISTLGIVRDGVAVHCHVFESEIMYNTYTMDTQKYIFDMPQKTVLTVVAIVVCIGGYVAWKNWGSGSAQTSVPYSDTTTAGTADARFAGTLPSIQTNPLEDRPNINPADAANPIKNIKTNPFAQ